MKTKFIFVLAAILAAFGCEARLTPSTADRTPAAIDAQDGGDGQRLVSLIDYVAADYGGAVANGVVVSAFEYDEQLDFLETAAALAPRVAGNAEDGAAIATRVEALRDAVRARADAGRAWADHGDFDQGRTGI